MKNSTSVMKSLPVTLLGNEYRIQADDGFNVLEVVKIVDDKLREIHIKHPKLSRTETADYACLNLVGEFLREEQNKKEWTKQRIQTLIEKLERVI